MGSGQIRFDNLEHPLVRSSFILYVYSMIEDRIIDVRSMLSFPVS